MVKFIFTCIFVLNGKGTTHKTIFDMDQKAIILNNWEATYEKEDWYPPLKIALDGLDSTQADWKPAKNVHSVRELVNHLLFYKDRFLHRLKQLDYPVTAESNHDTFLGGPDVDKISWEELVARLGHVHRQIRQQLESLGDSDFDKSLPEKSVSSQALSLILHDAYHTGQILLLRKLQDSWPEQRE
jgi:uncharacterized damage-inducible protein DinB